MDLQNLDSEAVGMDDDSVARSSTNVTPAAEESETTQTHQVHVDETSPLVTPITRNRPKQQRAPVINDSSSVRRPFRSLSKGRHWKNLFGLATAFMVTFTAYGSLQNLQSSLNYDAGLGLASLSVIYGCLMISCLIAPVVIRTLGTKWTIALSLFCYTFYTAANFYPQFYTLLPAAAILGLAAGPLWAAQGTYLTTLAISFADVVNDVPETIINQFNGIFFLFFQSNQIWGNLLSSVILSVNSSRGRVINETELWKCGRNGTGTEGANLEEPGEQKTHLLLSVYLGFGVLGAVVAIFCMDSIRSNSTRLPDAKYLSNHLLEVIRLMRIPYIGLLIPLMIYSGFEQAYIFGDFTKSFVSCTLGVRRVGYVMIAFGVTDALSSLFIGRSEVYIGRKIIFTAGGGVNLVTIVWMLFWRASGDAYQAYQLYLMAVFWGFSDAVWQTQISSILGVLMPQSQEAAFANLRFWQAVGFVVSFSISISDTVLVLYKLIALLVLLVFSMICYYIVEWVIRREGM